MPGKKRKSAGYAFEKRKGGWGDNKRKKKGGGFGGASPMDIPASMRGYVRTSGFYSGGPGGRDKELKFHDLDTTSAAQINATGEFIPALGSMGVIVQGTGESQRDGRKCVIKKICWKFEVFLPAQADQEDPPPGDTARIILYLDKQANGAIAAVTDIVESADYQSFNNLANKSRFVTLMDRTYDLNRPMGARDGALAADPITASYPEFILSDSFYKSVDIPLEYSSTTGAIAEIRSNNICCLAFSKSGLATFKGKMRLRFVG